MDRRIVLLCGAALLTGGCDGNHTASKRPASRPITLAASGVRLSLPAGWDGRSVGPARSASQLTLQAASLQLPGRDDEFGNRASKRMRKDDVRMVLMEFPAEQIGRQGFRTARLPLRLRPSDFRSGHAIAPHGHALARRHFASAGRAFSLFVEFGRSQPAPRQRAVARQVLSSLSIRPRPGLNPHVWDKLRRPLHLPRLAAGARCPRARVIHSVPGTAYPLGPGPVYPNVGSADGRAHLRGDLVRRGWYLHKTLWAIAPSYRGPVLIRARQLDRRLAVRFGLRDRELRFPALTPGAPRRWGYAPTSTVLPGPGCFGYQIDGVDLSTIVVFKADLGSAT